MKEIGAESCRGQYSTIVSGLWRRNNSSSSSSRHTVHPSISGYHCTWKTVWQQMNLGIKIRKREWKPLLISIQSELSSLASIIVHWPPLYSLTKNARFCEPGVVTFSRRHLLFVCRRTSRKLLRENWWGSRQLRMLTWFSVIWSLFQFLLLLIIFWVKNI